ncbi:unnamed protein product [Ceutorhynchus assimilis]|uniref:Uncharacterized protein n=1 Tax=Ceutorhynchus assimilis TaxID=467358 RepID=A0A9N9MI78_9CUCU|nr:unnamed protein product [Ceutorhynchus assimilis]
MVSEIPCCWYCPGIVCPADLSLRKEFEHFDDLGSAPSTPHYAIDGKTPLSNLSFAELQRHIHNLNLQLKQKDMLIESYQKDMEKMKQVTRSIIESGDAKTNASSVMIDTTAVRESSDYFNSYSHFGIHHEMLNVKKIKIARNWNEKSPDLKKKITRNIES